MRGPLGAQLADVIEAMVAEFMESEPSYTHDDVVVAIARLRDLLKLLGKYKPPPAPKPAPARLGPRKGYGMSIPEWVFTMLRESRVLAVGYELARGNRSAGVLWGLCACRVTGGRDRFPDAGAIRRRREGLSPADIQAFPSSPRRVEAWRARGRGRRRSGLALPIALGQVVPAPLLPRHEAAPENLGRGPIDARGSDPLTFPSQSSKPAGHAWPGCPGPVPIPVLVLRTVERL